MVDKLKSVYTETKIRQRNIDFDEGKGRQINTFTHPSVDTQKDKKVNK